MQTDDKFMLRLPEGMRSRIKHHARQNLRSMNSEIVLMISSALSQKGSTAAGVSLATDPAAVSELPPCEGGVQSTQA
jgi:hypothetical protein